MNYHFFIDEKFVNDFISDVDQIDPNQRYIVLSNTTPQFVNASKAEFYTIHQAELDACVAGIIEMDRVFIHWFTPSLMTIIDRLPIKTKLHLMFWGGDFLELDLPTGPNTQFNDFLYDPLTRNYMEARQKKNAEQLIRQRSEVAKRSGNLKNILHTRLQKSGKKKELFEGIVYQQELATRKRFLERLDCIYHWNPFDIALLEKLYSVKLKWQYFIYNVGISELSPVFSETAPETLTIWIGNSDTPTNNHLDALAALAHLKNEDIELICPLNYGDKEYGDLIENRGKEIFGNKFKALRSYILRDEYYSMMDRTRVAVMFHNRGQAGGNLIAFLKKGIKLYMKDQSSIAQLFRESGMIIHSANTLQNKSIDELRQADSREIVEKNIALMDAGIANERKRLDALKTLILSPA